MGAEGCSDRENLRREAEEEDALATPAREDRMEHRPPERDRAPERCEDDRERNDRPEAELRDEVEEEHGSGRIKEDRLRELFEEARFVFRPPRLIESEDREPDEPEGNEEGRGEAVERDGVRVGRSAVAEEERCGKREERGGDVAGEEEDATVGKTGSGHGGC